MKKSASVRKQEAVLWQLRRFKPRPAPEGSSSAVPLWTTWTHPSVSIHLLRQTATVQQGRVRAPRGELTESSSADQREPVELQGPQQSSPQVTLPGGHQGHPVQWDGCIPETQSVALRVKPSKTVIICHRNGDLLQ